MSPSESHHQRWLEGLEIVGRLYSTVLLGLNEFSLSLVPEVVQDFAEGLFTLEELVVVVPGICLLFRNEGAQVGDNHVVRFLQDIRIRLYLLRQLDVSIRIKLT